MALLGDKTQLEAHFGPFRDSANLTQDRCMVCAECTIGLENIFDTPDGTPMWHGSSGILFRSIWTQCWCGCKVDAWFCAKCTIGSEIVSNAPDGTPR